MAEAYEKLESAWSEFNGLDPAGMVACSSGTAALHLGLEALRLPPGSRVLTSDYNMIAVPRACVLAGLIPAFVDCGDDLLIDPKETEANCTDDTSAIIAVHVYGRRCDMASLADTANLFDVFLIEDLAEAHGIRPHERTDVACWSFYRNKIVGGEEGGAAWFRDPRKAELARSLRCLGFTEDHDYRHIPRGHNYRLANSLARLILASLHDYSRNLSKRRRLEMLYRELCPVEWRMPTRDAPWVFDVRIPGLNYNSQREVVDALNREGIAARQGFKVMSSQQEFRSLPTTITGKNALTASCEVFYLPLSPDLSEDVPRKAFEIIQNVLSQLTSPTHTRQGV